MNRFPTGYIHKCGSLIKEIRGDVIKQVRLELNITIHLQINCITQRKISNVFVIVFCMIV